jgi:KipI family sensor histidine kinase inhibitor
VRYLLAGDRGLVVEFGNTISPEINDQVRILARALEAAALPGLVEVVPTYRSLGIQYDPETLAYPDLRAKVEALLASLNPQALPPPALLRIPTVYGGGYGPDLPFVAQHAGLSEDEVIRLHSETAYRVYMIGFAAGFAYLGGLPERLHTPRLPSPRLKVPKGSVAIGGGQTGAYPAETPGGWRLIGRTAMELFDPAQEIPTPMQAGDTVQFVPIDEKEYLARSTAHSAQRTDSGDRRGEGAGVDPGSRDGLAVLRPGLLTTVQDRGRYGYQKFGVPVSGAADQIALRVGNILVGNPQTAAGLEITAEGPELRALTDLVLALTGAPVQATLDGEPVPCWECFRARSGQVLDLRGVQHGLRAYLTVAGGVAVPRVLRSRSTCLVGRFGGFEGRAVQAGDVLPAGTPLRPPERLAGLAAPEEWRPGWKPTAAVRVVLGPQDDAFTEEGRQTFLEATYRVSPHTDRMGCRLEGPAIAHRATADIISDWVPMGGVQVPGDAKPIVLLADRQTTGGYTKIATVIWPDLGLIAQRRPGEAVRFQAVSVDEAQEITRRTEAALAALPEQLVWGRMWDAAAATGEIPGEIYLQRTPLSAPDAAPAADGGGECAG